MNFPTVRNLCSPRSGREVANQFVIDDRENDREIFQSYSTIIAVRDYRNSTTTLDTRALDYSNTTSRYLYEFLDTFGCGIDRATVLRRIAAGTYLVADLNGEA